jgi:hypothetical protein
VRSHFAEALTTLADTTHWVLERGAGAPADALTGATPFLRMFSLVTGGWLMAKQAVAALQHLEDGTGEAGLMQAKLASAQFFCEHILPGANALAPAVMSGFDRTMAIPTDYL